MLFPYVLWCRRAWPLWAAVVLSAMGTSCKDECDESNDAAECWVMVDVGKLPYQLVHNIPLSKLCVAQSVGRMGHVRQNRSADHEQLRVEQRGAAWGAFVIDPAGGTYVVNTRRFSTGRIRGNPNGV